jgi:hypothetical protein
MPAKQMPEWPVRGTPGGYHDLWDDPDPVAAAHDQMARVAGETDAVADVWRAARAARTGIRQERSAAEADRKPPRA